MAENKWEKKVLLRMRLMKFGDKAPCKPSPSSRAASNAIAFYSLLSSEFMTGRLVARSVREHSNGIRWRIRLTKTGRDPSAFLSWAYFNNQNVSTPVKALCHC